MLYPVRIVFVSLFMEFQFRILSKKIRKKKRNERHMRQIII